MKLRDKKRATLAMQALTPEKFVVAWKNSTKAWVPLSDRIAALLQTLSEDRQQQVLSFVQSLHQTPTSEVIEGTRCSG